MTSSSMLPASTPVVPSAPGREPTSDCQSEGDVVATPAPEQADVSVQPTWEVHIQMENCALKEEISNLKKQLKDILNHSIESDQRLLNYTNDVFVVSSRTTRNVAVQTMLRAPVHEQTPSGQASRTTDVAVTTTDNDSHREDLTSNLREAKSKIQQLEAELMVLRQPCTRCGILREESANMISTIRTLEEQLKARNSSCVPPASPVLLGNRYGTLQDMDEGVSQDSEGGTHIGNFVTVRRRKRTRKRNRALKSAQERFFGVKPTKAKDSYKKVPFKNISVSGDSHIRSIAGLLKEQLHPSVTVSGMCKPGAGLMTLATSSDTPPAGCCHVLVAGTNDVAAGRGDIIYKKMENSIVKLLRSASKLVVSNIPHRHDLPPNNSVNASIRQLNNYIAELCSRYEDVELLDFARIRRWGFTRHGMHLNMGGKRVLARLIADKIVSFVDSAPDKPRDLEGPPQDKETSGSLAVKEPAQPSGTVQQDSYAEVVKQQADSNLQEIHNSQRPGKINFLGNRPLVLSLG